MVVCCGIWLDLLGFSLSCVFGCGGGSGCVVVAVGRWLLVVGRWLLIVLMSSIYYFNV